MNRHKYLHLDIKINFYKKENLSKNYFFVDKLSVFFEFTAYLIFPLHSKSSGFILELYLNIVLQPHTFMQQTDRHTTELIEFIFHSTFGRKHSVPAYRQQENNSKTADYTQ